MMRELDRYGVIVAALQETKWMGSNVYQVGGSVVLATGRQVPGPGEPLQRGEGVTVSLWYSVDQLWGLGGKQGSCGKFGVRDSSLPSCR